MRHLVIFAPLVLLSSASSLAEEDYWYFCEKNQQPSRAITVRYNKAPAPVPCQVSYITGEETEGLWSARVKLNYCETKAETFMEQQQQWGWRCEKRKGSPPS